MGFTSLHSDAADFFILYAHCFQGFVKYSANIRFLRVALMEEDSGRPLSVLRVDGGASVSNFMMQFEADMLRKPIDRPRMVETTAFGAAFLAGLAAGVWSDIGEINDIRVSDRIFVPQMGEEKAKEYYKTWLRAVERSERWDVPDDEKSIQKC